MTKLKYQTKEYGNLSIDLDYTSTYSLEEILNIKKETEEIVKELSNVGFKQEGIKYLNGKIAKGENTHLAIRIQSSTGNIRKIINKNKNLSEIENHSGFEQNFFWDQFSEGINTGVYVTVEKLTEKEYDSLRPYMEFPNKPFQIGKLNFYLYSVPSP